MPQWYDITRQEGYQNLPPEDRSAIKQMFFERYVSPEIDKHPELKGDSDAKKAAFYKFMQLPDDTGQGQITSGLSSAVRGFGEIVPGAIQGAGALTGIKPLENAGESIRSGLEYVTPVNPLHQDTVLNKGAGVVGQIGSVLATAGVGGAIGKGLAAERIAAGATAAEQALAASQAINRGANTALYGSAGLQGAASGAQSADRYGLTGANRYGNILAGAVGEMGSEMLGGTAAETSAVRRLLSGGSAPRHLAKDIFTEGTEEYGNQVFQNAALGALAPAGTKTPDLTEGALEAGAYGAFGGGILGGINIATGAYKPAPIQAADTLIASAEAISPDASLTAQAAKETVNDLTRYMPPTELQSGLYEAPQPDLSADAFFGLKPLPNEQSIDPATGIPVPQDGAGEVANLEAGNGDINNLGGGVLPEAQLEEVEQAPSESVASLAEGVNRPTTHRLFEGGSPIRRTGEGVFVANDPNSAFRLTGAPQIEDMINSGVVRSKAGKIKGGREGEVHWSRGHESLGYAPREGAYLLQTPAQSLHQRQQGLPLSEVTVHQFQNGQWVDVSEQIRDAHSRKSGTSNPAITELARQAAARLAGTEQGPNLNFPQVSPSGAAPTGIATTTGQPMPGGSGVAGVTPSNTDGLSKQELRSSVLGDANARWNYDKPVTNDGDILNVGDRVSMFTADGGRTIYGTVDSVESQHPVFANGQPSKTWDHDLKIKWDERSDISQAPPIQYLSKEASQDQPLSPAATPTQETPLTPSGQVVNEGVVSDASSGTEAEVRVQPPVETKVNADVEASSGKVEAGNAALDEMLSELAPVIQAKWTPEVRAKADKYFESGNYADLDGLTSVQKTKINAARLKSNKEAEAAQKAADKLYEKRLREEEKENARLEKERENQVKLTESRRKAYDSIIGTPSGVEMGAVSPADGQEALAALHNTGDVPGVLNAFVGTSGEFLANAENEKNFPALWQLLQTGRVDEGNFVYGRAFVFTDGIGINRMDRENAARYGTTPAVAAVRRVLTHESLVHRGIFGLPAHLQARIIQWVMQNTSPEQLDMLAKDYPQYENWRGDEFQMMALAEEYLAKTVESINGMPKIGPIAHLVEILRDIWRWITGRTDDPTIQNLRDVVKLLKAGAQAADARLVNGGKVDILASYAGSKGNIPAFMRDSLIAAQAMASDGKTAEEIRAVTGWFPGKYDGKMRWEIPDNGMTVRGLKEEAKTSLRMLQRPSATRLSNLIDHPALFEAYPQAKDIVVIRGKKQPSWVTENGQRQLGTLDVPPSGAAYWPKRQLNEWIDGKYEKYNGPVLAISTAVSGKEFTDSLLHEIQHWIQDKEGFASGGDHQDFNEYRKIAGEIESRDVEARRRLTNEQRKAIAPYSSENISPEDATVFFEENSGKVSRPAFAAPINAELARAAERFRQMQERQSVPTPEGLKELFNPNAEGSGTQNKLFEQQVSPQQIRNEIRAAYDRALVGQGSVQVSLQRVFDEAKAQMPTLTERQFGEQVQALYEDGSAFLVPTDRGADMLADGEKWGVYDVSGQPSSYLGIMPVDVKASRVSQTEVPKAIKSTKGFAEAIDAIKTASPTMVESQARALKDHLPDDHIQQGVEPRVAVSIALIERLLKSGIPAIELPSVLNSPAFLESLGIENNADMQQYLSIEALNRINREAVGSDNISERNELVKQADGAAKIWNLLGESGGRSLGTRGWLMKHPRYAAMFVEQGILSNLANQSESVTKANIVDPDAVVKGAEKAGETAKEAATTQTDDDLVTGWMEAAEETLSPKAKGLFDRIREKLARIGYLMGLGAEAKKSVAGNLAAKFAQEYKGITKDSIEKEIAKLRKEVEADLSSFADELLGKDAPKEAKERVKKSAEKAAKKEKRGKLSAEEKLKKKQERANAVAQRLIYRTEEVFRQGFKNEAKQSNADSILKAFRDQVKEPVSDAAFKARVKRLNVSETVAERMLKTAARERGDQEQIKKNALLDSVDALKKIMYKLSGKLGIFQIDPTSWRKLFSTSATSQEQRKTEMQEAIKADPAFSKLDADEQKQLADLLDEAWQAKHDEVLKTEIKRLTRSNKMSDKAKEAINDAIPEIIQMVNRGTFDNAELASIVAKKFGFRDLTTEERAKLREITEKLQQDITPWEHKKLANELRELLADVTNLNFAELAEAWWVSSVLSGPRTSFTIGLGFLSGGFEVIKNSLGTILLNPNDTKAWDAAFKSIKGWVSSMPREAQRALAYLKTGDVTLLDPTMSNDAALIDRAVKELGSVGVAAKLLKSKNPIARLAGQFMSFMQKLLTALDMFNGYTAKYAALPLAYYQSQSIYDPKELDTIRNHALARQQVLNSDFGGNEPTSFADKARLNAWATDKMWKDIGRLGTLEENANYLAQTANMTLSPTGVGGIFYHTILGIQANQKKKSAEFLQKQKEELLNTEGIEKSIAQFNLALGYIYQFAAHNFLGALGLKFSRFAGSKINQTLSFIPLLGLTRLAEKTESQKMHLANIAGAQSIGFLLLGQALWILSKIAEEPDDDKRGWDVQGPWSNLTPERKQQLLAAGKREYTIFYKGHRYSYANWPISGMLSAVGSMADLIRYSPDQWNEKSVANRLASGVWAAAASVGDSAALSQLSELLGTSMASRDPIEASMGKFNRVFGNYAGGFIPRVLKDVDLMQNPKINTYKTLWERLAKEVPVYRRFEGKPLLDVFGNQVAPSRLPWSRELVLQPPEESYRLLGALNDNGVWLSSANPQNRMVGKGKNRRPMTEIEADRYVDLVGKGYEKLVLDHAEKALTMPKDRAKAFISDKADAIRDRAAKQSVKRQ